MQNSTMENPLYKKGYKGYTMLKKEGDGFTVPFEKVGQLAVELYKRFLPLKEGPFGAPNQPAQRAVQEILMQIRDGPLDVVTYKAAIEFKTAIDALPNPAPPAQASADEQLVKELKDCIRALFDDRDAHTKLITDMREEMTTLRRKVDLLDLRTRPMPTV
jgi:hypothetical protein